MTSKKDIVVFDGVCVLCNRFFNWLIKNDKDKKFMYTNFQSNFSRKNNLKLTEINSVAVIKTNGEKIYKVQAVYYILKKIDRILRKEGYKISRNKLENIAAISVYRYVENQFK